MKSTEPIYNGYSLREILSKLPDSMKQFKPHRKQYIQNCIEVYSIEKSGINTQNLESIKNANFLLIQFYLKLDGIIN